MASTVFRCARAMLGICFVWSGTAHAYNEGGHYYTLLALLENSSAAHSSAGMQEIKLQAFCAELPDLAQELDAITQRVRVLESTQDHLWGLLGRCQTHVSSHMVASQYYLHGLSGTPAPPLRDAAKALLKSIDADLRKTNLAKADRLNLLCARGFAAHLYGDTYAHVKLSSERRKLFSGDISAEMYATGLGHARDGHTPDYLYAHRLAINKWPQWVLDAGMDIAAGADTKPVLETHWRCAENRLERCEEPAEKRLAALVRNRALLMLDMQQFHAAGHAGIGDMERTTPCEQLLESGFPQKNDRPQCAKVWKLYLEKSVRIFGSMGIDPASHLQASTDKSCSAWRCAGRAGYEGAATGSCTVEIIDELGYGTSSP